MEPSCVRHTLIPATSRLFGDFLYHFERVSEYYPHNFTDPKSFEQVASEIEYPDDRRQAIVAALRDWNGPSEALDRLARPGTVAVVTGQQVGAFSGPAYTVFKAVTAARLARELTESGIEAVPVFWLATEDHDLAEVDHAWVFNHNATPTKITLQTTPTGAPVGMYVPDSWNLEQLRQALGDLPYAADVLARLQAAYRPGASLGQAFFSFLKDVLRDLGLIFIDPLLPSVRAVGAPFLAEAVRRLPELVPALRKRSQQLESAGYHAQVNVEDDSSLLFLINGKRTPLRWKDDRFVTKERAYSMGEVAELGPALSPNALLRPVLQDFLLPTAAYVGGPAEIAYMAQSAVLYDQLLHRMPVIFPRNSLTLLDTRSDKVLRKYSMRVPDLLEPHDRVRDRMAARLVPHTLKATLEKLQGSVAAGLGEVDQALGSFDKTLQAAARKSAAKMQYQAGKLAAKTAREMLRRDERASRDAEYVLNYVYPHRHLQERFYSIVPFLAQVGLELPARLLEHAQLNCPDHMVRAL